MTRLNVLLGAVTFALVLSLASAATSGGGTSALAAPPNDDFADATLISSLPFRASTDLSDASADANEPQSSCMRSPVATVWYRYTAASSGPVVVDSTGSESFTRVSIFTDSQFGMAEVACTDFFRPRIAFDVEAGIPIYIQAATHDLDYAGHVQLEIEVGESPLNDSLANASAVKAKTLQETVDMLTATAESNEPQPTCARESVTKTVWYSVVAKDSTYIGVTARGANGMSSRSIIDVYEGSSWATLRELSCVTSDYFGGLASFKTEAGNVYYVQVGLEDSGDVFGASAGFFQETTDIIQVEIDMFDIPACAPSKFTFTESPGDLVTFGLPVKGAVDVTSVAGGHDGTNYCLRIGLEHPLPSASALSDDQTRIKVGFDTDSNWLTGGGMPFDWPCYGGLGWEVEAFFDAPRVVLEPLERFHIPSGTASLTPLAFILYDANSVQIVVPLAVLGDEYFRLAISTDQEGRIDCVPNGGAIISPMPAEPGDVNCDGRTNSLDSSLILQRSAALLSGMLPCEYAGDVNQNSGVGPVDAVLILQYNAGMISQFAPAG